jgi:FkbM family methyltransferase
MRIYDIGANLGNFTEAILQQYADCEIIMVEANPELVDILKDKFGNNEKIKIVGKCLSDLDGINTNFYICDTNTISTASEKWTNYSRFSTIGYREPITVETISLDTLIEIYGDSDYIKIDVEGYEMVVIKGIRKYQGLIAFEWAEELKSEILESVDHLTNVGYSKFYIKYDDNYTFIPEKSDYVDNLKIKDEIGKLDEYRQEMWGMIFAI